MDCHTLVLVKLLSHGWKCYKEGEKKVTETSHWKLFHSSNKVQRHNIAPSSWFGLVWFNMGGGVRWLVSSYVKIFQCYSTLPLTSSHLLLFPPSYYTLLPNLLPTPPTSSWRASDDLVHIWRDFNVFLLRKVSWLVVVGGGGDIAIIATSSRSRSLIWDLRWTFDLDPSLTKYFLKPFYQSKKV